MTTPSKRKLPASNGPFEEAWSLPLKNESYANVLVSDRHVFVGEEHAVAAYDVATGRRLWAYPVPGRLVAADADALVVDTGNGESHVVDVETGHPRLSFWGALTTPSRVEPGRRAAARVGKHLVLLGSHHEHERAMLRAVDIESGQRLWTYWPEVGVEGIAASQTRVVAALWRRKFVALDAADGRVCWEHACTAGGQPLVDERRAFVACIGPNLVSTEALDLESGRPAWTIQRRLDWVGEGKVYALSEDKTRIEAWDAITGRREAGSDLQIERPPSLRQHTPISILLMSETHIFMTGLRDASAGRRSLLCLDRATGRVWGHTNPDAGEVYAPVLTKTALCYRTSTCVYGLRRVRDAAQARG